MQSEEDRFEWQETQICLYYISRSTRTTNREIYIYIHTSLIINSG